jgi:hypothetical protein
MDGGDTGVSGRSGGVMLRVVAMAAAAPGHYLSIRSVTGSGATIVGEISDWTVAEQGRRSS